MQNIQEFWGKITLSRLTDLIARAKAKDPDLGRELEREFKVLSSRRAFGLNFERHTPESVELPGRAIRKGDKVRILEPRGSTKKGDKKLWRVIGIDDKGTANLEILHSNEEEETTASIQDLVAVAEFQDYIYPGLVSTGKVSRGGDKPFHTVINGENFHALEALTFTHRGKVDAIYIDPPYNTRAKDWKYNNDYVDPDDSYVHSKWLAMMERRLKIAKKLLNPYNSVLIVTIDEKEHLRLGILLQQIFQGQRIQVVSSTINPSGVARGKEFYRVDEYIFFVYFGKSEVIDVNVSGLCVSDDAKNNNSGAQNNEKKNSKSVRWGYLLRSGTDAQRKDRSDMFYPVLFDEKKKAIIGAGDALELNDKTADYQAPAGTKPIWPIRSDANNSEGRWQVGPKTFRSLLEKGYVKIGSVDEKNGKVTIKYLPSGLIKKINNGEIIVTGEDKYGGIEIQYTVAEAKSARPKTQWNAKSHSASDHGSSLLRLIIPSRKFPFPKSLYAVEDALRFFVLKNKNAVVLDFFAGSGTTAHAVMRLNKQDEGNRQCISVTNNEVANEEQKRLRADNLRPGDAEWEKWGICDYITKPRIAAAITGKTPEDRAIEGDYGFTDEFPMADGFAENAEFFTLTYESPIAVSHNLAFHKIAPLLWMRAGSEGKRIERLPKAGWAVVETYGLLTNLDKSADFCKTVAKSPNIRIVYIVTDDEKRFQSIVRKLPDSIEPVRLYESYLTNFRFSVER